MPSSPTRHFLGWDRPVLHAAVDWLWATYQGDFEGVTIALPGRQAGRRLEELLALAAATAPDRPATGYLPPRILTAADLTDDLVELPLPPAAGLARTLAWDGALRNLSEAQLGSIALRPPSGDGDLATRLRLAGQLRKLHSELAQHGVPFSAVAEGEFGEENLGERRRWQALAAAQAIYRTRLADAGRCDPHEGRLDAIADGSVLASGPVLLLGVVEPNPILTALLEAIGDRVTALIAAPDSEADGFTQFGALRTDAWRNRDLPLSADAWRVADNPEDQARHAVEAIASWEARYGAESITLGLCDPDTTPYLVRRLGVEGVVGRSVQGTPLQKTAPAQLLAAIERFLRSGRFRAMADLARHPDLEPTVWEAIPLELREASRCDSGPALLDAFHARHLADRVPLTPQERRWVPGASGALGRAIEAWHRSLLDRLGDLASGADRPIAAWCQPVRELLESLYGNRPLRPEVEEADRLIAAALRAIGRALGALEEIPSALLEEGGAATAADLLSLLRAELEGQRVPPPSASDAKPTIDLLGWLELGLDDTPALVVTGFNEGHVPAAVHGDPFLPDRLRRALGLTDNDDRLARDLYTATLLLATRSVAVFISGRRTASSDPLTPSRLIFHRPKDEIAERVLRFARAEPRQVFGTISDGTPRALPSDPHAPTGQGLISLPVTAFGVYLRSPYHFYLARWLRLESTDDRALEMEPLLFGNLAHTVLDRFGRRGPVDATDPRPIQDWLSEALSLRVHEQFGNRPLPAVQLQVELLRWRLRHFAEWQAARRAEGWQIVATEWQPPAPDGFPDGSIAFLVDEEPIALTGRIDRIERHDDGRWALLDYKTGEQVKTPMSAHGGASGWQSLQLPLYVPLAESLVGTAPPELGYVALGKNAENIGLLPAAWSQDDLNSAYACARDVVRRIRAGRFQETGKIPRDSILQALFGEGLLTGLGEEDDALAVEETA